MEKQLQQNVNKILAARKIQKNRIEQNMEGNIMEAEELEKRSKNVVDTLKSGFQEAKVGQIQQQQHSQQILDQLQRSNTNQGKMLQNILEHQRAIKEKAIGLSPDAEEELRFPTEDENWIQNLYKNNRDMARNRTTMYELDIKEGKIGINGKIDVNKLFNNNILSLKVNNKTIYQLRPHELSQGLAALVLLPYKDIEENRISIKADDVIKYMKIMKLAGYNPSVAKKYTEIIKRNEKHRSVSVGETPGTITGTGIFHYNDATMLENRLQLLSGSIKAGNTSNNIREEMRSIVDELLRIAKITPRIHMLLYKKFGLINF